MLLVGRYYSNIAEHAAILSRLMRLLLMQLMWLLLMRLLGLLHDAMLHLAGLWNRLSLRDWLLGQRRRQVQ